MTLGGLILLFLLVVANGFFVAAEFALVKVRAGELRPPDGQSGMTYRIAANMLRRLDAYLSACQLGITLASLGLGWIGEPVVARMMLPLFHWFQLPDESVHYFAFPLAFLVITFLHITVGEQAPKIWAIQKARATTLAVALPLALFYRIFQPFIWVINSSSNLMLRAVGMEAVSEHDRAVTEDEVRTLLIQAAAVGNLSRGETSIMENVLDLESKTARRYMVPRNQVVYLDNQEPLEKNLQIIAASGHTRLPLCDGDLDHVMGVVHVKDLFRKMASGEQIDSLVELAGEACFLHETICLDVLLRHLQKNKVHLALVVDEYGVVAGMITMEKVLEQIVGPIQDEFDDESPLIVEKEKGRFEVDAACPLDDAVKRCQLQVPEGEADTVGGAVVETLGHIPKPGESVLLGIHQVTVLDADPRRVKRVLIERPATTPTD